MTAIEFRTAAAAAAERQAGEEEEEPTYLEFNLLDANGTGKETLYFVPPTSTQIALYTAGFALGTMSIMSNTMEFLKEIFWPESYERIVERLKDRKDPLEFEDLPGIIRAILTTVTARPTQPSSDSASTEQPGGRTLTDHLPPAGQTRSRSPRNVSAT